MTPEGYLLQHSLVATNLELVGKRSFNEVYISNQYALKISRPETRDWISHPREAQMALSAIERGIRTPKPIAWGDDYSIWEKVNGETIHNKQVSESFLYDLLDTLELIHNNPFEPIPNNFEGEWMGDESNVEYARNISDFSAQEIKVIEGALLQPSKYGKPVFIHGDVYADNIFSNLQGEFVAIIDWGNAGWHSLERECAFMDQNIFEASVNRWKDSMDLGLLWKMHVNLLLEILPRGVISVEVVKDAVRKL